QVQTSGKIYTNKDLGSVPESTAPPPPPAAAGDSSAAGSKDTEKSGKDGDKSSTDGAKKDGDKASGEDKSTGGKRDQASWAAKMKGLRETVDRDQTLADAMQSRINALTADFVNRDDPAQKSVIERDRQRAVAELERLRKQIVADKKAIADA